jgi:hypothetical protein
MAWIIDSNSRRRLSARIAGGLALSAILLLGAFVTPAEAGHRGGGWGHGGGGYYRGGGWNRGYYAPPVVYGSPYYGSPYYYPPPVIYGPGIGVNIGIR